MHAVTGVYQEFSEILTHSTFASLHCNPATSDCSSLAEIFLRPGKQGVDLYVLGVKRLHARPEHSRLQRLSVCFFEEFEAPVPNECHKYSPKYS